MNKVYFVSPMYDTTGPRSIRFKNIINEINNKTALNVTVFKLHLSDSEQLNTVNVDIRNSFRFLLMQNNLFSKVLYLLSVIFVYPDNKILVLNDFLKCIKDHISTDDCVKVVVSRPFSFYLLGYFLKKERPNIHLILDMGDPFFNNSASKYNCLMKKYYEKFCLNYFDELIVTNQLTKEFLINEYNYLAKDIYVIPQGGLKIKTNKVYSNFVVKSKIKVVYAGTFYKKLREPFNYLEAVSNVGCLDIESVFIGVSEKWIKGYSNVEVINRIPNEIVYGYYEQADFILFIDNMFGIQTSGKIFELLIINKPLLIISHKDRFKLFDEYSSLPGVFIVENDKNAIISFWNQMYNKEILFDRRNYIDAFTWDSRAKQYIDLLLKV